MITCEEWSLEFDQLYNNIMSNQAPGLEKYEKSVFLTRAQEAVVTGLYDGTIQKPFESTEEITSMLYSLVQEAVYHEEDEEKDSLDTPRQIVWNRLAGDKSHVYELELDTLFVTYEACKLKLNKSGKCISQASVVPVTQDEFWRTVNNPFKKQNKRRVLRLTYSIPTGYQKEASSSGESEKEAPFLAQLRYSELVSDYPIDEYRVRYIKRPSPIILEKLTDGRTINGEKEQMTCELPEAVHQMILVEAVKIAKAVWNS